CCAARAASNPRSASTRSAPFCGQSRLTRLHLTLVRRLHGGGTSRPSQPSLDVMSKYLAVVEGSLHLKTLFSRISFVVIIHYVSLQIFACPLPFLSFMT